MAYSYSSAKSGDSFVVKVSAPGKGEAVFTFDEVVAVKGSVEATVTACVPVRSVAGKAEDFKYVQRLSAYSAQSRGDYARQLKECFGSDHKWPLVLSGVVSAFVEEWKADSVASIVAGSDIVEVQSSFVIGPWIEEGSANLLYAKGGTGKTYLALRLALSVLSGKPLFASSPDVVGPFLFIDYENNASTFVKRLKRLASAMGLDFAAFADCWYWDPKGVPLHVIKDDVARFVAAKGIKLVIVDSAAPACGGPPEDASVASQYFAALRVVNCTSLTIAHEAKAGGGTTAFGSVFWTNFSRNIFYLEAADEGKGDIKRLVLKHQKFNNGPRVEDFPMMMKSYADSVAYEQDDAKAPRATNAERVVSCLRSNGGQMTIREISDSELMNYGSVNNVMQSLKDAGTVERGTKGRSWKLIIPKN